MPDRITITINGKQVATTTGVTIAAALLNAEQMAFRMSVNSEPRAPLCGMGICFECRVTVDGQSHIRSCQFTCRDGMDIRTDG